jgi:predicted DNA-binding protein YlxM (UPF0122 family)
VLLDALDSRQQRLALLDRYGGLLTDRQRRVLDLHLRKDWSLAEIASRRRTSRAAVHDLVRRSLVALEGYERRLGMLAEEQRQRSERAAVARELGRLRRRLDRLQGSLGV